MTVRTIKTHSAEADRICDNKIRFIFRNAREHIKEGDVIQFLCIKDKRPVLHKINNRSFVVTEVNDCMTAPVAKGFQVIGFRRMV